MRKSLTAVTACGVHRLGLGDLADHQHVFRRLGGHRAGGQAPPRRPRSKHGPQGRQPPRRGGSLVIMRVMR